MISWVRRARLIVPVAAVALVAAGCVDFTGTKVITGEGTPTGDFVVEIRCEIDGFPDLVDELVFQGEETVESQNFNFLVGMGEGECFITEIEQAGATTVTYQCGDEIIEVDELAVPPEQLSSVPPEAGGPGSSLASRGNGPVTCTETPDGLEYDIDLDFDESASVTFTVINDFAVTPPTTAAPTTTTAPPVVAPAVGAATPIPAVVTFTG